MLRVCWPIYARQNAVVGQLGKLLDEGWQCVDALAHDRIRDHRTARSLAESTMDSDSTEG